LAWFSAVCSHQTKGYFNFPVSNHLSSSLQATPLSWQYSSASFVKPLREKIKPCTCSTFSGFFTSAIFFSKVMTSSLENFLSLNDLYQIVSRVAKKYFARM
jgi:hypothetical protein